MYKIILSIIILVLLFFINNIYFLELFTLKNLNNEGYKNYRLGDFINGYLYRKRKNIFKYIIDNYKDSLCVKYYNKTKNLSESQKWYNYEILSKLVDEIQLEKSPSDNDLTVHLRLGDIINLVDNKFE